MAQSTFLSILSFSKSHFLSQTVLPQLMFTKWFCLCYCCSFTQSWLTLCNPMDCSMPGFPVLHYLPELAQTHVLWIGDAIQASHPLLFPSTPAFNLSQQGLCLTRFSVLLVYKENPEIGWAKELGWMVPSLWYMVPSPSFIPVIQTYKRYFSY